MSWSFIALSMHNHNQFANSPLCHTAHSTVEFWVKVFQQYFPLDTSVYYILLVRYDCIVPNSQWWQFLSPSHTQSNSNLNLPWLFSSQNENEIYWVKTVTQQKWIMNMNCRVQHQNKRGAERAARNIRYIYNYHNQSITAKLQWCDRYGSICL